LLPAQRRDSCSMAKLVREPIYQQLNNELRDELRSGTYPVGTQFLTERQIAERFAVSRITANKALSSLVAEGLLDFRKGVGTFVREPRLDYDLRALVSFTDKARAAGLKPSTRVLSVLRETADALDPLVATALGIEGDAPVIRIERLRMADGEPLILERRVVIGELCPGLENADLTGSLYQLWQERYELTIAGAEQTIRAVNLDADDAAMLKVPANSAALEVGCIGRLSGGRALWWEQTRYRADRYAFQGSMGSSQPAIAGIIG
jgi:GntR family transcriptional regulator